MIERENEATKPVERFCGNCGARVGYNASTLYKEDFTKLLREVIDAVVGDKEAQMRELRSRVEMLAEAADRIKTQQDHLQRLEMGLMRKLRLR